MPDIRCQIRVKGHLGPEWSSWFDGLTITNEAQGEAILTGTFPDDAAIYGVLMKMRDIGLPLLAFYRSPLRKVHTMKEWQTSWHIGVNDAPTPPIVETTLAEMYARGGNLLPFFLKCYQTYGQIFRICRPDKSLTVLAGPEANMFVGRYMTEILSEQAFWQGFIEEYRGQKASISHEGEVNRARRILLSRSYSRGRILDSLPLLADLTLQQTANWQAGQSIPFYVWVQELVAEQLGQMLTHHSAQGYVPDFNLFLSTSIQATMTHSQAQEALQAPAYLQAKTRMFEFGRSLVAAHRAVPPNEERQPDIIDDLLMAATRSGMAVSDEHLAFGALGPFLAGLHTVSIACCSLLYALLARPEDLTRVVAEATALFAQDKLTWEHLRNMDALHGAAMEALRLYPVSTGHTCHAIQPFSFAGYGVEAGEEVFVAMTVPHFLPELFSQPEHFDIDRYSEPRNEHRQRGAYTPFGLGDHSCLGAGIAEIQLMMIIATLLVSYEIELDPVNFRIQPLAQEPGPSQHELSIHIVKDKR